MNTPDPKAVAALRAERLLRQIQVEVRKMERARERRDELIREAVQARVPRADIMAASGLGRTWINQIARPEDK